MFPGRGEVGVDLAPVVGKLFDAAEVVIIEVEVGDVEVLADMPGVGRAGDGGDFGLLDEPADGDLLG